MREKETGEETSSGEKIALGESAAAVKGRGLVRPPLEEADLVELESIPLVDIDLRGVDAGD